MRTENCQMVEKGFFHLLDVFLLNSYYLYKLYTGQSVTLRKFSLEVISGLLDTYGTVKAIRPGKQLRNPPGHLLAAYFITRHYLEYIPGVGSRPHSQRRCHVCFATKKRPSVTKKVSTQCHECNLGFCLECFREYHTKIDW